MPSAWLLPSASLTANASATAGTKSEASVTAASETKAIPSRNRDARRWHTSIAVLVFPMPPGPVTVTTRCRPRRSINAETSASLPRSGVRGSGRLLGRLANRSPLPWRRSAAGTANPTAETGWFDDHIADVDADPHGDVRRLAEFLLDLDRTSNGIQRVGIDGQGAIP